MIKAQFEKKIKRIRSENGGEFVLHAMSNFYASEGIMIETSSFKIPQQNGIVERKHRHIHEIARCLMFKVILPTKFWRECVLKTTYIIIRLPSKVSDHKTPFKILFRRKLDYSHMKTFGCLVYNRNTEARGDKFEVKGSSKVFVG